jgi:hypothetical protein
MVLAFPPRQEGSKTELQDDTAQFVKFFPAPALRAGDNLLSSLSSKTPAGICGAIVIEREMLGSIPALGRRWHSGAAGRILEVMSALFDQTDFSMVVKNRAPPPKSWRWEIYRAGRKSPIECSSVLYETVEAANRAGKEALKELLTEFPA